MNKILDIQVQKLFVIVLFLKVVSSYIGWHFQSPWLFGTFIPLALMGAYIALGMHSRDTTVTDEKFADTCYYLGFIFTITSIIFSLFDLPNIGTKIQEIAVRFGAAMVSTVLGLAVRVYLVSFKEDVAEALIAAEDAALEATRRLGEQMGMALESLKQFEFQVQTATKASVERVNMEVENLSKDHAGKLNSFFVELSDRNQEQFTLALAEVRNVSRKLSDSVDDYAGGMKKNLTSIEAKVSAFADAVTTRLEKTTFPDDYFAQHLDGPMGALKESAHQLAGGVRKTSDDVSESALVLTKALNKLRLKANSAEASLDAIDKLTEQQQAVIDGATSNIETLGSLSHALSKVEVALGETVGSIRSNNDVAEQLVRSVTQVALQSAASRKGIEDSMVSVVEQLGAQASATSEAAKSLKDSASASIDATATLRETLRGEFDAAQRAAGLVASQLAESTKASATTTTTLHAAIEKSSLLATRLDAMSANESRAATALEMMSTQSDTAARNGERTVQQLDAMAVKLGGVESALKAQRGDLEAISTSLKAAPPWTQTVQNVVPSIAEGDSTISSTQPFFAAAPSPLSAVRPAVPGA